MFKVAKEVFKEQVAPKMVEIINSYGCENLVVQVNGSGVFSLIVSGRTNPHYEYQTMSSITDSFNIVSTINAPGIYSFGCGGRGSIKFELVSVSGSISCQANMF